MGTPMAYRLLQAGHQLSVWNRSRAAAARVEAHGAHVSDRVAEVFTSCEAILLVLATAEAADSIMGRIGTSLSVDVANRLVIQLGTTLPDHSLALANAVSQNGGRYVEAPVSGSRIPAEQGRLVAMLGAACEHDFAQAAAILECFTAKQFRIGAPPQAMRMKLAVNAFLVPLVIALAEAWGIGEALGLDMQQFAAVLKDSPMSSEVARGKLDKLAAQDWTAQASITDVLMNAQLIASVASDAGMPASLVSVCEGLLRRIHESGNGALDMVAAGSILR